MENNNKGVFALLIVIIVILATLCVLFATGTISFNSNKKNDNEINNNVNDKVDDSILQENNYAAWMNYILEQEISKISIERHIFTGMGDSYEKSVKNIDVEQLKSIFNKFMDYSLKKTYYVAGGYPEGDILNISYVVNGTTYDLQIANGLIWDAENIADINLVSKFENSEHTSVNEELKNNQNDYIIHYNYKLDGFTNSVFDEYFK